jgi:hypothetical protein
MAMLIRLIRVWASRISAIGSDRLKMIRTRCHGMIMQERSSGEAFAWIMISPHE